MIYHCVVHTIVHALFEPEYHDTRCLLLFTSKSQPSYFVLHRILALPVGLEFVYILYQKKEDSYQYVHSVKSSIKDKTYSGYIIVLANTTCRIDLSHNVGLLPYRKMNEEKHVTDEKRAEEQANVPTNPRRCKVHLCLLLNRHWFVYSVTISSRHTESRCW